MGNRIVKNYPSPRLLKTIGATNQKTAEAIGELVANSFDARYQNTKLQITVDTRNNRIAVIDNGKGMSSAVLEKAVCIAEDMSRYIERGEGAKGHFGMGFKTSCATLGGYYDIFTRPVGENVEYHIAFDITDYGTRPSGADAWDVVIEDAPSFPDSPLKKADHGTAFLISKLKDENITVSAILTYLGEAFKSHLDRGDVISIIDSHGGKHDAQPHEYEFIKGTRVDIDETFGPGGKYHITGWVALDTQTHNDGLYGFNIYRYNQLVEKYDKTWFRAHLMTSRIIGEVNMDFLDATFYKQGVQQSEDWEIVKFHMKDFLKGIVKASNSVSKKGNINKPAELKKIVDELHKDYGIGERVSESDFEAGNSSGIQRNEKDVMKSDENNGINDKIKNVVTETSLMLEDEGEIAIIYMERENAEFSSAPYDYIFSDGDEEGTSELQVIVFKNHPLWQKKVDDIVKKIVATSDAIYRVLVEKLDFDTSEALKVRNEWVAKRTEKLRG